MPHARQQTSRSVFLLTAQSCTSHRRNKPRRWARLSVGLLSSASYLSARGVSFCEDRTWNDGRGSRGTEGTSRRDSSNPVTFAFQQPSSPNLASILPVALFFSHFLLLPPPPPRLFIYPTSFPPPATRHRSISDSFLYARPFSTDSSSCFSFFFFYHRLCPVVAVPVNAREDPPSTRFSFYPPPSSTTLSPYHFDTSIGFTGGRRETFTENEGEETFASSLTSSNHRDNVCVLSTRLWLDSKKIFTRK